MAKHGQIRKAKKHTENLSGESKPVSHSWRQPTQNVGSKLWAYAAKGNRLDEPFLCACQVSPVESQLQGQRLEYGLHAYLRSSLFKALSSQLFLSVGKTLMNS